MCVCLGVCVPTTEFLQSGRSGSSGLLSEQQILWGLPREKVSADAATPQLINMVDIFCFRILVTKNHPHRHTLIFTVFSSLCYYCKAHANRTANNPQPLPKKIPEGIHWKNLLPGWSLHIFYFQFPCFLLFPLDNTHLSAANRAMICFEIRLTWCLNYKPTKISLPVNMLSFYFLPTSFLTTVSLFNVMIQKGLSHRMSGLLSNHLLLLHV